VKGRRFREVPLHPHLVELGFSAFAEAAAEGYRVGRPLFYESPDASRRKLVPSSPRGE